MPFRSRAQERWGYYEDEQAREHGKKPPIDVDEWEEATEREHKKLPERVKKPKKKSHLEIAKEATGTIDWECEECPKDPMEHPRKPKKSRRAARKSLNDIRRVLTQIKF